jgi:vacuolar protein sorting-associated protein 8
LAFEALTIVFLKKNQMLFFWNQGEKTQSPVTAMCFNQQGDLLLVGYGDGHMTIWDVQKATAAKVIYGEHMAPVVHVCFIRQSKAITGDSKGVVLLHTFSIIPVINRLTVKGTQVWRNTIFPSMLHVLSH